MGRPKVFGIGFHKTGTTSLSRALTLLGYRVTGPNEAYNPRVREEVREKAWQLVQEFDAFQDNPWPILYRELDERYPGSKFVLTLRPTDEWIASVVAHFGGQSTPMREWIYGVGDPKGNEAIYVERYERHNREVLSAFQNRPADLLTLNITGGDGWEKLCPFLGVPEPAADFPHANKGRDRAERPHATGLGRLGTRLLQRGKRQLAKWGLG